MESVEFKFKGLEGQFFSVYTKRVVEVPGQPHLSVEIGDGKPGEIADGQEFVGLRTGLPSW